MAIIFYKTNNKKSCLWGLFLFSRPIGESGSWKKYYAPFNSYAYIRSKFINK
ncbi:MAG: hypothetical protein LBE82_01690 [Chitinophagaceae bacterium]|nr:hypothetical protein [Chitinophagaceae bacterium]